MKQSAVIKFGRSKSIKEAFLIEALNHVCARDVLAGDKIMLPAGSVVDSQTVAFLAAAGIDRVPVYGEPRVSVLVIGDGLMAPGVPAKPGKSYDSCIPALQAALENMRLRPVFTRRLAMEPKLLRRLVPFGMNQSDLMILMVKEVWSGMGDTLRQLEEAGAQIVSFEGGSEPETPRFDDGDRKVVFCLPYNPESILKYFHTQVQPAIRFFMGYKGLAAMISFPILF